MSVVARVVMYSRRTCGLCDEARTVVESVRARVSFAFDEVMIDGDDGMEERYGLRVPVVEVDGREAFEYEVSAEDLEKLVLG